MGCHRCLIYTRMLIYMVTIALHATNIILVLNSLHGEPMEIEEVRHFSQMQMYFFTCWTFVFQMLYAAFAIFCEWKILVNTSEKPALPELLIKFRDAVFTVVVFPASLMVSTYFWGFYAYDRNLLYPEYFDTVITPTSNHIMHTLIMPLALLELVVYPRQKPDSSVVRLLCLYGLEAVYVFTLFYAYKTTGVWVYPIFGQIDGTIYLPIFLGFTALYLTVLYYAQFWFSTFVLNCREKIGRKFCKAYQNQCVNFKE